MKPALAFLLLFWPVAGGAVVLEAPTATRPPAPPASDIAPQDISGVASPFERLGLSQAEAAQMEELAALTAPSAAQTASPAATIAAPATEASRSDPAIQSGASDELFDHAKSRPAAAEIELDLSPEAMSLLTTEDGTVASVLRGTSPPRWLTRRGKDWAKTPWDSLSYQQKINLLRHAGPKLANWWSDRAIPGLAPRDSALLQFAKPVEFLGKSYPAGRHEVSLKGALGKVEYRDENEIDRASGIELHVLSDRGAGAAAVDAWTLLDGLGLKRVPLHVHALGKPLEKAAASETSREAVLQAAAWGETYRRANLLAEFVTIALGGSVYDLREGCVEHFGRLKRAIFESALDHLRAYFAGGYFPRNSFKIAWVGLRGPETYAGGLKRLGFEYRAVHPKLSAPETKLVLDAVHEAAYADMSELSERMRRWLAAYGRANQSQTWYSFSGPVSAGWAPAYMSALITPEVALRLNAEDHVELQMLVHDWGKDPLLLGDRSAKSRVRQEQKRALQSLAAGDEINLVMKRFLRRSGLYAAVLASFGLKEGRFGRIEKLR